VKSWRKQVGDHKPGILLMAVKEGGSGSRLVGFPTVPPAWECDEAGAWPLENQVDLWSRGERVFTLESLDINIMHSTSPPLQLKSNTYYKQI